MRLKGRVQSRGGGFRFLAAPLLRFLHPVPDALSHGKHGFDAPVTLIRHPCVQLPAQPGQRLATRWIAGEVLLLPGITLQIVKLDLRPVEEALRISGGPPGRYWASRPGGKEGSRALVAGECVFMIQIPNVFVSLVAQRVWRKGW